MIERAEIDRAFELCLRRPVGDEAAYAFFTGLDSLDAVYATLFNAAEFRGRLAPEPDDHALEPLEIEVAAAPESLARMVAHVEATWTRLGETEPHWSVITEPRFKTAHIVRHQDVFRDYGRLDDMRFGAAMLRAGIDLGRRETCFEFGCGTGRVTEWLARRFPQVIAADISAPHLAAARAALAEARVGNVAFRLVGGLADLDALPAYDMLHTRIVLQHNPPPVIAVVLARLLARLTPGGAAYVQVPVWIPGYRFSVADYLAGMQAGQMEMHALPQRTLLAIVQDAGCRVRELREDPLGPQFGGISNTLVLEKT